MLTKNEFIKALDLVLPVLKRQLKIKDLTVEVIKADSAQVKSLGLQSAHGCTYNDPIDKKQHIIFVYDTHKNITEAVNTIVHELLHVVLRDLRNAGGNGSCKKSLTIDEKTTKILTSFIMRLL